MSAAAPSPAPPATIGRLKVRHFRCFEAFEAEFGPGLNFIVGPNAQGKTSLLEAACILLRLQSPRTSRLPEVVQHHRRGFVVDGYYGPRHLQFYYGGRRKLALDAVEQRTATEYLALGRVVYFATADMELVRGSAEVRRRLLDFVAAQHFPEYRGTLRAYERALRSRNALLKQGQVRWREVEAFEGPLLEAGVALTQRRAELVRELEPQVQASHRAISADGEVPTLEYAAGSGEDFAAELHAARAEDVRLRQTSVGPHRDEVRILLNQHGTAFASEGQQRTVVLSLRLAAARLLEERHGVPPVLLLDDIFGELDPARRTALLRALPAGGQKLITLTSMDWVEAEGAGILRLGAAGGAGGA